MYLEKISKQIKFLCFDEIYPKFHAQIDVILT